MIDKSFSDLGFLKSTVIVLSSVAVFGGASYALMSSIGSEPVLEGAATLEDGLDLGRGNPHQLRRSADVSVLYENRFDNMSADWSADEYIKSE